MKKVFLLFIILVNIYSLYSNEPPSLYLSLESAKSTLFFGEQRDYLTDIISPTPNKFSSLGFSIRLKYYFKSFIGIEGAYTPFNALYAADSNSNSSVRMYDINPIELGLTFRHSPKTQNKIFLSTIITTGVLYSNITYSQYYYDEMEKKDIYLYDIIPEFGGYFELGSRLNFSRYFFIGISAKVYYLNNIIDRSNYNFDGFYWCMPIVLGLSY